MVLFMNRPSKRSGSKMEYFRKRIPDALLAIVRGKAAAFTLSPERSGDEPLIVQFTFGNAQVKCSLRTNDPTLANLRNAEATAQFKAICDGYLHGSLRLDQRQVAELAGVMYRSFAEGLERVSTGPEFWQRMQSENQFALQSAVIPAVADTLAEGTRLGRLALLERRFGPFVDSILVRARLVVDAESRNALLFAFAEAINLGCANLERKAKLDFSPDPAAHRFPTWEGITSNGKPTTSLTFDDLLTRWQKARDPAPGSVAAFKAAVEKLKAHLGHNNPLVVTKADIRGWRDALHDAGLGAKSINDNHITHIRTLFRRAVADDLVATDPTAGVRDERKEQAGQKSLPYTDEEVAELLALADAETTAHLRWIPWLLAFTGARVGEIAQLWGEHVKRVEGIQVISITPTKDGGRLKNVGSERDVPLHPAILDRGFLEFVATRKGGPLFYGGPNALQRPRKPDQKRHASKGVANRVGEWVRRKGFNNPRKAPNHAFRHWFKSICPEFGILDSQANLLQGHSGNDGEAGRYRHRRLKALHEAICKVVPPTRDDAKGGSR